MIDFFQKFTFIEGITIVIAELALGISLISFFNTINRDKRQLRIGRIEEMIEIIHTLMGNYHYFDDTFFLQNNIRNKIEKDEIEKNRLLKLEKNQVIAIEKISRDINLREKLIRLTVLTNAYLPQKKLRNKIRSFVSLYTSICETTLNRNYDETKEIFSIYPRPWVLLPYIEVLLCELIQEMNLGYNNNIYEKNPFEEEFRKELNLK